MGNLIQLQFKGATEGLVSLPPYQIKREQEKQRAIRYLRKTGKEIFEETKIS